MTSISDGRGVLWPHREHAAAAAQTGHQKWSSTRCPVHSSPVLAVHKLSENLLIFPRFVSSSSLLETVSTP